MATQTQSRNQKAKESLMRQIEKWAERLDVKVSEVFDLLAEDDTDGTIILDEKDEPIDEIVVSDGWEGVRFVGETETFLPQTLPSPSPSPRPARKKNRAPMDLAARAAKDAEKASRLFCSETDPEARVSDSVSKMLVGKPFHLEDGTFGVIGRGGQHLAAYSPGALPEGMIWHPRVRGLDRVASMIGRQINGNWAQYGSVFDGRPIDRLMCCRTLAIRDIVERLHDI